MKKLFALALSLVMMTAITVPAFAVEPPITVTSGNENAASIAVNGVYVYNPINNGFSVDISWGAMQFTYTKTDTWNAGEHRVDTTAGWSSSSNTVTVINNSNADVIVKMGLEFKAGFEGLRHTLTPDIGGDLGEGVTLAAAAGQNVKQVIATLVIEGEVEQFDEQQIGTLTVALA